MIPLQFLTLNLTSPAHVVEANETMLIVKAHANDNVTRPTFRFDFGDGTDSRESFFNTASHMYHFIGNYTINVQAWSLCNSSILAAIANISVPKPVRILENISLHGETTMFGESTQFRLLLEQGSDFKCLWFLGDNVNHTISRPNPGEIIFNHVYLALGTYTVRVTCKNRRSELAVSAIVEVQRVILGLQIYPVPPILFGAQFLVRWGIENGTDVAYKANFSGVSLEVVKSADGLHGQAWVAQHDYKTPGEFYVHVAASNAITKWVSTRSKCIILRSVAPFTPRVFHNKRDIEINETVSVSFTDVNSALDINASYIVNFGDKSEVMITRNMFANHSYYQHGLYTVNITADNEVSRLSTSIIIKVHKPVLKLEEAIIPSVVAKVNENVNITMFLFRGSDFVCQWQFGDGEQLVQNEQLIYFKELSVKNFTDVSITTSHVFEEVGVYKVSVTCENRLSQVNTMGYATVQEEITLFQVSTVTPVPFGKTFFLNFTIATGTNVTFTAFLNRQELYIEHQKLYHLSKVTPYIYKQSGQFNLTITAWNLVSPLLRHRQVVFIEIPVSGVHINMSYLEANILHAGHGANMNIFPENVPVVLQATTENGTSLQYTWAISNATDPIKNKTVMHKFYPAGIYMVSLLVQNHVSRVNSVVVVAVQKRASFSHGTSVECSSRKVLNEIVIIKTSITNLGTNSTLRIDVDNTTSYWYGDHESYLELPANDINMNVQLQYKGRLEGNIISHHIYNTPGIYTIKAILGNAVSKSLRTCEVEILSRPCKKPTVKLKSVGDTPENAKPFFRADTIHIETDVDVFCPESKESKYEWNIFQSNPRTGLFERFNDVPFNEEASMQEIRLKRRTLPVGLFRVSLTVGMVEDELKEFMAVVEGYIRVVQSPLIAEISGGSEIRRGFGSVVSVDGLNSYDPDFGPGNYTGMYNVQVLLLHCVDLFYSYRQTYSKYTK